MKRILALTMALILLIGTCAINVSAGENEEAYAEVYLDNKISTSVSAKFVSGEVYICLEDILTHFGYDIEYRESSFLYTSKHVEAYRRGERLLDFYFYIGEDYSKTYYTEEGLEYFGVEPESKYDDDLSVRHEKMMIETDESHHYIYYKDIVSVLDFEVVADFNINTVGIFIKKSPEYTTLYDKKGNPVEVCQAFEDKYFEAGYKTKLEDVTIIPESKIVSADGIKVSLNGGLLEFDVAPATINGRTMVPLRAIFEALSATVDWQEETRTVISKKEDTTIKLTVDSNEMDINGKTVALDSPATIVDGRTLVPVRAISEAFGLTVDWKAEDSLVILREEKYADVETVLLYDLSNQVVEVPDFDIDTFKEKGWLSEKPVMMYALDGRTQMVTANEVEANKKVGWYTEPSVVMYAADGRTQVVPKSDVEANKAVGWYEYPVATMYAADGRTVVISSAEIENYKAVGWYTASQYYVLQYKYLAGNDFRSIRRQYSKAVANGAYLYPYTDSNGDSCILVYISYKIATNWNAFYLHNITKGTVIENPSDYYNRIADDAWGSSKLHYMDLATDALSAQANAMKGFLGQIDTGIFVDAATLNK